MSNLEFAALKHRAVRRLRRLCQDLPEKDPYYCHCHNIKHIAIHAIDNYALTPDEVYKVERVAKDYVNMYVTDDLDWFWACRHCDECIHKIWGIAKPIYKDED